MDNWQDVVLSVSVLAFNFALVPSLIGEQKPRMATSLITALFMMLQVIVFFSLSLWYSFSMALINSLLWFLLLAQGYLQLKSR